MQKEAWEKEYRNPKMITGKDDPQACVLDFLRWLRKKKGVKIENLKFLDLGCGTGRNTNYLADLDQGNQAVGIDISETALKIAEERALKIFNKAPTESIKGKKVEYIRQSMAGSYPFPDKTFDIAIDITSSNSLSQEERGLYIKESHRVLKDNGYFFLRALCKDGDQNAKNLLKISPGKEKDTYFMKELGLFERVFTKEDLISTYSPFFDILEIEKETHYPKVEGRIYKRNFWIVYMIKK